MILPRVSPETSASEVCIRDDVEVEGRESFLIAAFPMTSAKQLCRAGLLVCLVLLLAQQASAAYESPFCAAQNATCYEGCPVGEVDFQCDDSGPGSQSISCTCQNEAMRGGMRRERTLEAVANGEEATAKSGPERLDP
ncbi:hypothetical protein ACKKBG_A19440 [Auxenochlorella protothecoides x Auxenochlorella symbiontica]